MAGELVGRGAEGTHPAATLWEFRGLVWNFAQRDLKARFKGTLLGWSWSLVIPLATLLVYSVVFSVIFRGSAPPMGDGQQNFTVWLWAGLLAWGFFQSGVNTSIGALLSTGTLMKKIYFPSYTPVLGSLIAVGIQSAIELGLLLTVLAGLFGNIGWSWLLLPAWLVLYVLFVTGISVALSTMNVHFRDLTPIIAVLLQLLFYATPIIYQVSHLSGLTDRWYGSALQLAIRLNPVGIFIEIFRDITYGLTASTWRSWLAAVLLALVSVGLGVLAYVRHGRDIAEEL